MDILGAILKGGSDTAREAGIEVIGGHSVDDNEPKYGMSVTGIVDSAKVLTNAGAQPGDKLILTKPLGSGILTTAIKKGKCSPESAKAIVEIMATLNRKAAEAMEGLTVHALTDITGFGLLGHLYEMICGSGVSAKLSAEAVPILGEVHDLAAEKIYPGGAQRNLNRITPHVDWENCSDETKIMLSDPQTSGGLLIAVSADDAGELVERLVRGQTPAAALIGEITEKGESWIQVS